MEVLHALCNTFWKFVPGVWDIFDCSFVIYFLNTLVGVFRGAGCRPLILRMTFSVSLAFSSFCYYLPLLYRLIHCYLFSSLLVSVLDCIVWFPILSRDYLSVYLVQLVLATSFNATWIFLLGTAVTAVVPLTFSFAYPCMNSFLWLWFFSGLSVLCPVALVSNLFLWPR